MQTPSLEDKVSAIALANNILMDETQGLTKLTPGVMIFYGVKRDKTLHSFGMGKQDTYLALLGEYISIEHYVNDIKFTG